MKYLFFLILPCIIFAQTTMCFKNNWKDLPTVEDQKFDGGECKGKYSISEMKKDGWKIDDIKLSSTKAGMNFIYILKKADEKKENIQKIDIKNLAKEIEKQKKVEKVKSGIQKGKDYYKKVCEKCHGKKGEIEVYGNSRALNKLSFEEMKDSIRGYILNEYDRGSATIMKGYAELVNSVRLERIKLYLDSINKK